MLVLGLTGSIAMGKSTTADMLRRLGVPAHDADGCVHRLFARGGSAVRPVEREFPGVAADGAVDRGRLGAAVFGRPEALARLEAIVHPLVRADRDRFLAARRRARARVVALDVPLLFESGGEKACDAAIVVSAPRFLQRRRALARPGMTPGKLAAILARQTPDAEKRRRADVVVPTGAGRALAFRRLKRYLLRKRRRTGARGRARCAKSCWTPRRPGWKSRPGTGSSRSGRWNS